MPIEIDIHLAIQFSTPFHSGTGLGSGLMDRVVRRDHKGLLFIPATTFKGVLRNQIEDLLPLFPQAALQAAACLSPNDHHNNLFLKHYLEPSDLVETLFGSNIRQGKIYFSNLVMRKEDQSFFATAAGSTYDPFLQVENRTGARVYRSTGTVAAGALFRSEYGRKDLEFTGRIHGWLPDTVPAAGIQDKIPVSRELFFLAAGLRMTERIAGNKSTGMGLFTYNRLDVQINGTVIENTDSLFSDNIWEQLHLNQEKAV